MKANDETKGTRSPIAPTDGRRSAGGGRGAHRDLDGEEVAVGLRRALRDADLARRARGQQRRPRARSTTQRLPVETAAVVNQAAADRQ
jgi:hypothetical protein